MPPPAGSHVLMTTDAVGGVWQYSTDLASELAESGYTITLAVLGPSPDASQRSSVEGKPGVQLLETGLPLDWMCADASEASVTALSVARLAADCGADLVHCNSPALIGAAPFPVPVIAAAHGCIATWWDAAKTEPLPSAFHWHRALMRRGLMAADRVVAPSASFAATLKATYDLPQLPCVIHNGRAVAAGGGNSGHRIDAALTVGRMWDPVKNSAVLDRAAAMLDMPFLAAGALHGPHGELAAFTHIAALGQLPGSALDALLALRPIFVSGARFEPFGLAVLEAAAAGCALVLSDIPTFRELWEGAALFVDPADADGFAAAISLLRADTARRAHLEASAQARAVRYRPAAMAGAMASLYETLLARQEVAA